MKHLIGLGLATALMTSTVIAGAEPAFTTGKAQVGVDLGYGIYTGDGNANPYGLGIGVRGGYTLDMNLHLGGSFQYNFGESSGSGAAEASFNTWNLMFEPGYDIGIGDTMAIRPQLGIGMTNYMFDVCVSVPGFGGGCSSESETKLAIAPGAMFLMDFGPVFGIAGLRYHHVFIEDVNVDALLLNVGAGMAF